MAATNWSVDDEATSSLVSAFGNHVAQGLQANQTNYAAALQRSKRWLKDQIKWKHPYYWAPLVLVGTN